MDNKNKETVCNEAEYGTSSTSLIVGYEQVDYGFVCLNYLVDRTKLFPGVCAWKDI